MTTPSSAFIGAFWLVLSEKGFYGMAFLLSLFAAVTVQKNVRDLASIPNR